MSRIRRLSIRGLRNFGTENEESTLRFSRPLTLILGPNGTGKTTIIEALKFATTGEFPPDSDKGKAFVHDPVFSTTSTVRCVVKAEIIDGVGDTYVISRTVESGKHQTRPYLKTLDNSITRQKKGSTEAVSVTNRCIDADTEITSVMGVSKPILKYVMFCHQEELSWPFESSKVLKEKFDEIFDSTKFNKAIENISKYSRQLQDDIRVLKSEVNSCEILVEEVNQREKKIKSEKERLKQHETTINTIDLELEPLSSKMKEYAEMEENHIKLSTEEEKKALEYKLSSQQAKRLRDNIVHIFEGTTDKLQSEIDCYDNDMIAKSTEIAEFEASLQDANKEETKIRNMLTEEKVNIGTFKQQIKHHEEKVRYRDQVLNEALYSWNLETVESDISSIELRALTKRLEERMKDTEQTVEKNKIKRENEERNIQKEVDAMRSMHSKIESERDVKKEELEQVQRENADLKSEIKQIGITANKLNSIDSKKKQAQEKINELSKAMDVNVVKQKIENMITLRNDLESQLNEIDLEITSLHKQSSLQNELEFNKSALLKVEKEMEKIQDKQEGNIKEMMDFKEIPKRKIKADMDSFGDTLAMQINSIKQNIQREESDLTSLETTMSYNQTELLKKEKELESNKERILSICSYKQFDEALLLQAIKVKDVQDKRGMYAHQGAAYKEYMKQLRKTDPCCPLCHRGFSEGETVQQLLQEMESEMKSHPNRLKECEAELKVQQDQYDKMLQLKPVVERIDQLESEELDKLRDILEKTNKKITQKRLSIEELTCRKDAPEKKLAMIKETMDDMIMWDRCIDETSKLNNTIDEIRARLSDAGVTSERTIDEVQAEKHRVKKTLQSTRNETENMQLELSLHNEELQNARSNHNALHEEQLKIQAGMQKLKQLKDQQETLYSKEIALRDLINTLGDKVSNAAIELNSKIQILERTKEENKQKNEADNTLVTDARRRLSELKKAQNEVDSFLSCKIYEALVQSESKIEKYEQLIKDIVKKKTQIEKTINKLKEDRSRQEVRKMELADNMQLRIVEENADAQKKQCLLLKRKMQGIDIDKIERETARLKQQKDKLLQEKNVAIGNRGEIERNIEQYTKELQKDVYKNARKGHRKKLIELTVQQQTVADLKVCSQILDVAMLSYHEQRMAMINKIIKQLWKHVYTGSDTTSIEIRTEPTEGVGSARRTYNYKLVQTKHGREMDMKGRCSAGQKVLASIIIRLALAQTFCKECGILALDEPTTNLDEENANSLATALASVVKLRSQYQKNFQLIVISHDEKFLLKLADLNNKKEFYELYRKPTGLTGIKYCQVGNHGEYALDNIKEGPSSDEESEAPAVQHGRSHTTTEASTSSNNSSRKRSSWEKDSNDHEEQRPQKKRYVFKH